MNGVIYARFSSENQREESIDGQIRECTAYCEKNGISVVGHYIDRAMSAKTDNRPDFQRMIKDSTKSNFDVVVVWKLDRFARNRYDSAHYKNLQKKNGVKVISATENIADGPDGILLESVLEGMAEYYSAELSEKVLRGHTENALKCMYNGGSITYGFTIDSEKHFQLDPVTAPIVREIFTMYDEGSTMKEIKDHLKNSGIKVRKNSYPDLNFISRVLHNRKYIGEYRYRDIVTPHGMPEIVSEELFNRVQDRMADNKKAPSKHKAEDDYLLTTKLFCGTCGAFMTGESGTSSNKGIKYHYYRCVNTKKRKTCDAKHKSISKYKIEDAVINHLKTVIMDDAFIEQFSSLAFETQNESSSELPLLRKQLAEAEKGIENMLDAIQMGIKTDSTLGRLTELEETKRRLETAIVREEIRSPHYSLDEIRKYIINFRNVDTTTLDGRKTLVDKFINSVVVYDDYILINMNYKKGSKRISFNDIESSCLSSVARPNSKLLFRVTSDFSLNGTRRRGGTEEPSGGRLRPPTTKRPQACESSPFTPTKSEITLQSGFGLFYINLKQKLINERGMPMANIITGIRIACASALIFCPTFSKWFYIFYILGGISDVLDGIVARHLGKETKLGAQLDTIADTVFTVIVIIKIVLTVNIPVWIIVWTVCIAVIKCINIISGFIINKRFVSEHTVMNKICGVLLFAVPLCIGRLSWQSVTILIILTCVTATIAAILEGHYIRIGKEIE